MNRAIVGRGAAYGDFDNDGDLDLLITTNNGPARLLRNENANQNDLLRVKTVGRQANRDGIGAKVVVKTSKGRRYSGWSEQGSSYCSQSELPLTFGLGKPEEGERSRSRSPGPAIRKNDPNIKPNQSDGFRKGRASLRRNRSFSCGHHTTTNPYRNKIRVHLWTLLNASVFLR